MRERLVELIKKSLMDNIDKSCLLAENIADYLIENGVVVPPPKELCEKIGDYIFIVDGGNVTRVSLFYVGYYSDGNDYIKSVDDNNDFVIYCSHRFADFGKTVFLTREEAERALKGDVRE